MTLSTAPVDVVDASPGPGRDWAVVEIRPDGSLGRAELVTATEPHEAALVLRSAVARARPVMGSAALHARLGQLQAAAGHPAEAARSFNRGAQAPRGTPERQSCLGHLSLLEAYQGDLRRAEAHAGLVATPRSASHGPGASHARLALDWIHLDRADDDQRALLLDEQPLVDPPDDPWLATLRLLLDARLLIQARRPDAAVRLLAGATDDGEDVRTGWPAAVLRAARADAMLAAGEPRRALGLLTPLPPEAMVEASVATAAACLAIGDVRGADAVLHRVTEALDRAPLAVQLRAWLLEARVAEDRGDPDRGSRLVDRALHVAAWEGLRTPFLREWHWVRPLVDRSAGLRRTHRGFLTGFRDASAGSTPPVAPGRLDDLPGAILAGTLTQRELEVLDLISEMLSTEEIAATLYVSANTVKTHIKGIFVKLGVNRRVDAVRRGRQLGLC